MVPSLGGLGSYLKVEFMAQPLGDRKSQTSQFALPVPLNPCSVPGDVLRAGDSQEALLSEAPATTDGRRRPAGGSQL